MSNSVDAKLWNTVPRFAKGTCLDCKGTLSAALATETAEPLPPPPPRSELNKSAYTTIDSRPDLFKIVTPINIDRFKAYLIDHPNQPYVNSVCRGLRQGFWPWAKHDDPNLWKTYDNSRRPINQTDRMDFVREQRDEEIKLGRWSLSFGSKLLPGMYSSPIGVVPKPHSDKLRLVNDHKQEPYSPNSMITDSSPDFPNDTIDDLIKVLLTARRDHGENRRLVLWKSDVKSAYRLMPMHPLWQIRQIVTVDGERFVDRCNTFGSRAGGWVWASFISLVLWIAIKVKKIDDLLGYVDDDFSWDFADNTRYYPRYGRSLPDKQARYLELWDELGIPHDEEKQLSGSPLTIIGFEVDPNSVSVKLPISRRSELFKEIDKFCQEGQKRTLLDFQVLAGSLESALIANPFGRPGLSGVHGEMSGRQDPEQLIPVSRRVRRELRWLKGHIQANDDGFRMKFLEDWGKRGDFVNYVDACPSGLGLWIPSLRQGLQATNLSREVARGIQYLEAFAIVAALDYAARRYRPTNLVIFSDSESSVKMFDSLNTQDEYRNGLVTAFVDIVGQHGIWCRVFHIPGEENKMADALSRNNRSFRREDMTIQELGLTMLSMMLASLEIA
jgi:ribonuclease HI